MFLPTLANSKNEIRQNHRRKREKSENSKYSRHQKLKKIIHLFYFANDGIETGT